MSRNDTSAKLVQAWAEWSDAGCHAHPATADGEKKPFSFEGASPVIRADGSHASGYARIRDGELPAITLDQFAEMVKARTVDGFGVFCGPPSGELEMLEVEGRAVELLENVKQHAAVFGHQADELLERIGNGCVQRSPSGGVHFLYRVEGGARGNVKLARRPDPEVKNGALVLAETRGEGGWFVAGPSGGRTHRTGKPYKVERGSPATIPTITAAERDTLYALFRMLDEMPPEPTREERPKVERKPGDPLRPGDDYNARAEWDEILIPAGWKKGKRIGDRQHWTRPGKSKGDGTSATTSETGLYCFSTSAGLPTETPLSKFALFAHLHHRGDYGAAAAALRAKGYGEGRDTPAAVTQSAHGLVRAAEASPVAVPPLEVETSISGITAAFTGPPGSMVARVQVTTAGGHLLDVQDVKVSDQRKRLEFSQHAGRLLGIDASEVELALVRMASLRCHPPIVASGSVSLHACVEEWLNRDDPEALPTGLQTFDLATGGGLPLGAVTLFSAPPGVGKTAMALQLALGAMALDPGVRVVFGLGEMTRRAFARRVAVVGAGILGLSPVTLRQAKDKDDRAYRACLAVSKAFGDRLTIVDGTVSAERVGLAVAETGAKIAVFDYLQRLHSPAGGDDRVRELELVAAKVLELAVTRDISCILLSATAMHVGSGARVDQIVRGSGSPGFDAELAYLGEAPPPEERGQEYPVAWRCRKARSEALVDLQLTFDGPAQTFKDALIPTFPALDPHAPPAEVRS
jgi:hypothetical protein